RAQRGALGQALGDQIFLRTVNFAAAYAHGVDHRHAARGDVVAVADAAGRLPADLLPQIRASLLYEVEKRFGFTRQRLGRTPEAALRFYCDLSLRRHGAHSVGDRVFRFGLDVGVARAQVDAKHREV